MENDKIKELRSAFKDVIDASIAFSRVEESLDEAVVASFLICSPDMEASKDDIEVVLR